MEAAQQQVPQDLGDHVGVAAQHVDGVAPGGGQVPHQFGGLGGAALEEGRMDDEGGAGAVGERADGLLAAHRPAGEDRRYGQAGVGVGQRLGGALALGDDAELGGHLLHEVEQIADEMILIGRGRIVAQGDKKTLLSGQAASSLVTSLDNDALARALTAAGHSASPAGEGLRVDCETAEVGRAALAAGVVLTDLRSGAAGLEDLFLELTADTQREGHPAAATAQGGAA